MTTQPVSNLTPLLEDLAPEEGVVQDIVPNVDLFRITNKTPRTPQAYKPGIIILAQGNKRIFIGDDVYEYDPLHYLVLSVPLPLECETNGSKENPLLGLTIKVDPTMISEIMLTVEQHPQTKNFIPRGIYAAPVDDALADASIRLLQSMNTESDKRFLAPLAVKEIVYRVLCGEKGDALRALAFRNQRFFQISRILDKIHTSYNSKFDLNTLAVEAGMSISSFHSSFKAVTNTSPLQYIKNIKLHKARMLMIEEGINAYNAAISVGYESPSQFNREYKRLFGLTPAKDAVSVSA